MTKTKKEAPQIVDTKEIELYQKQVASAAKFSTTLTVKTKEDYEGALAEGKDIKAKLDAIVERKQEITKPLYSSYKSVLALFKPIEDAGETALRAIKSKMLEYTNRKTAEAEAEKLKLAHKVETGYMKPETAVAKMDAIVEQPKTVSTENGSATTRTVKKYYIVDKAKIPLQFMEANMVAIKASFRAGMPVAGVEEREEKELSLGY